MRVIEVALAAVCVLAGSIAGASGVRALAWKDLQPAGETERNSRIVDQIQKKAYDAVRDRNPGQYKTEIAALKRQIKFGVMQALDGQRVRLPGYVVPLELVAPDEASEFLLVPFYGACIHVPAPPPNQVVHVIAKAPQHIGDLQTPVWVEGILKVERSESELAPASYRLNLSRLSDYDESEVPYNGAIPHSSGY